MKKSYKILIIGDSNCLPKYSNSKQDSLPIENIYTHKLKKGLKVPYLVKLYGEVSQHQC